MGEAAGLIKTDGARRKKVSYIGAPACFALEQAAKILCEAFDDDDGPFGIYVVGSCLDRPDWRDVDVRMIMSDEAFGKLFPKAQLINAAWEFDPRWCLMAVTISAWLRERTGLPIDFQIHPMTWANERNKGKPRHAIGLSYSPRCA